MSHPLVTDAPVCVTGASGFIASHVVAALLQRGYRVRGTVRSLARSEGYAHLTALPNAAGRLELAAADLQTPDAFDVVVAGCEYVLHTASPYIMSPKDPQKDLVDPALEGTRNVLNACKRARGVRRVVLTSSMAAITDEPESDRVLTEADWNEKSTLDRNPYYYSKTVAEREAWRFMKDEAPGFELVVLNPFLVVGPSLTKAVNTSNQIFVDLLSGTYPGIMNMAWGFVDVRDVAEAHVRAMETPGASGRYICANTTASMREVVEMLRALGYERYKLPKLGLDCGVGDYVVRLGSYLQPKGVGSYLRTHVGRTPRFDHGKIRRELGLEFRPLQDTISETVEDLLRWGHVKPPA